jgi:hypothetical protein
VSWSPTIGSIGPSVTIGMPYRTGRFDRLPCTLLHAETARQLPAHDRTARRAIERFAFLAHMFVIRLKKFPPAGIRSLENRFC